FNRSYSQADQVPSSKVTCSSPRSPCINSTMVMALVAMIDSITNFPALRTTKQTRAVLKNWLNEPQRAHTEMLFPNARGNRLSGDGVRYVLAKHIVTASKTCPSLLRKKVTPHVLRHYLPFLTMSSDIGQ